MKVHLCFDVSFFCAKFGMNFNFLCRKYAVLNNKCTTYKQRENNILNLSLFLQTFLQACINSLNYHIFNVVTTVRRHLNDVT